MSLVAVIIALVKKICKLCFLHILREYLKKTENKNGLPNRIVASDSIRSQETLK
jgi:hypothetical protein